MNTRELIEVLKNEPYEKGIFVDTIKFNRNWLLRKIEQLDEPQKVKVSEEEAKFLKTFDFNCESDVTTALYYVSRTGWGYYLEDNDGIELKDLSEGFRKLENRERLIKAILDGYEVEEEKRYFVKAKGICEKNETLNCEKNSKEWLFSNSQENSLYRTKHTRTELEEAGFGWMFDCEGIEIKEVEDLTD